MFCLLVVLVELSVLAKWLARKTPLRKPNHGEGIVSRKPRPKSVHDFLGLLYCFIVLLSICVVYCPYVVYYPTVMVRYSLFVLKVSLNPKQTNKQKHHSVLVKHRQQLGDGRRLLCHSWSCVPEKSSTLFVLRIYLCFLHFSLLWFGYQYQYKWLPGQTCFPNDLIDVDWNVKPYSSSCVYVS